MPSLADAILDNQLDAVKTLLQYGQSVNEIDEYGFTPLIEAAIGNHLEIAQLLLSYGAHPNQVDMLGGTALHWAAENNNVVLAQLLLEKGANANAYNSSGQPVLVMPLLRQQNALKKLLLQYGADLLFAQDYINAKLLGHMYELVGTVNIVDPKNNFVEVDFEGFYLEVSLALIADSLEQFKNHYAGRQLRRYLTLFELVIEAVFRAAQLIKYQQYQIQWQSHQQHIEALITKEPLIIPIGYEGHAITFVKLGNILVKCDRREESRHVDTITFYQVNRPDLLTSQFISELIYEKQSDYFINVDLPDYLQLQPLTELKVPAQISGNCSWANVEACIPVLFFLFFSKNDDFETNTLHYKNLALSFFKQWREWNKDRALQFCIQSLQQADSIRKACKAEILAAVLFQSCGGVSPLDQERAETILRALVLPEYEPIIRNYVQTYCYEDYSEEGQNFLRLLRNNGYNV